MTDGQDFIFTLRSYQGAPPQQQPVQFHNYFPKSQTLQANVQKADTSVHEMEQMYKEKMVSVVERFMNYEEGVINIYPKQNTVDLKKHLERKMKGVNRKTEKAIVHFARQRLGKAGEEEKEEEEEQEEGKGDE